MDFGDNQIVPMTSETEIVVTDGTFMLDHFSAREPAPILAKNL